MKHENIATAYQTHAAHPVHQCLFFNANIKSCTDQISRKLASHRNRKKNSFAKKLKLFRKIPKTKKNIVFHEQQTNAQKI